MITRATPTNINYSYAVNIPADGKPYYVAVFPTHDMFDKWIHKGGYGAEVYMYGGVNITAKAGLYHCNRIYQGLLHSVYARIYDTAHYSANLRITYKAWAVIVPFK